MNVSQEPKELVSLRNQLKEYPVEVLAAWWCQLNCNLWPHDFPIQKPERFDELEDVDIHNHHAYRNVFYTLAAIVPRKEQLRAWHMGGYTGYPKSNQEFEQWWDSERNLSRPDDRRPRQ